MNTEDRNTFPSVPGCLLIDSEPAPEVCTTRIWTDGSCWTVGGPGGWAYVLIREDGERIERFGHIPAPTTNNRSELTAAIEALSSLELQSSVDLHSDSEYLVKGARVWIESWKRRDWRNVANVDLWKQIDTLKLMHEIRWHWVPGHQNKGTLNDRCDFLAEQSRIKLP